MKNKLFRKLCCGLLTAAMIATSLVGCGKETVNEESTAGSAATSESTVTSETTATEPGFAHDPNLSELGVEPVCKEKIKLTIGIAQNTNVIDYDTNALTLMLEELANVDIEFYFYTKSEIRTQLDLMVNAGGDDLPDIILHTLDGDTVYKYGDAGMFIPLNEFYENSSYYLAEAIEKVKEADGVDVVGHVTSYDGNIYSVPGYTGSVTNPIVTATWIYTPWLEALDLEVPKTTEQFYDVLMAFKTQDPNGNGKADEIPALGSAIGGTYGNSLRFANFCIDPFVRMNPDTYYLDPKDGKLSVSYTNEGFKEGIKYVKSLVEAGLYDAASFTQTSDLFTTIMNQEGDQLVGCFTNTSDSFISADHPSRNNWTLLPPLESPDGQVNATFWANYAEHSGYITKNCENPEAAFRLLDLMYNEVVMCSGRWGVQGENWDFVKDLKQSDYPDYNFDNTFAGYGASLLEYKTVWNQVQNANWALTRPSLRTNGFTAGVSAASMKEGTTVWQQGLTLGAYYDAAPEEKLSQVSFHFADADEAAELGEQAGMMQAYVEEKIGLWCTGAADIDADWENYLKELEAMGLSDWLAAMQAAYER
ncbi:MAG: extracellular solute-binding protein [Lachnospiraceae bacterium]|nr:extracellular solute-binding protein [Lachnospiraceae bacterium]